MNTPRLKLGPGFHKFDSWNKRGKSSWQSLRGNSFSYCLSPQQNSSL